LTAQLVLQQTLLLGGGGRHGRKGQPRLDVRIRNKRS